MKVPREKLGSRANALVNNLATQASNKGIPVKISDVISFKVNMGGSITNPTVKTDLAGAGNTLADDMKDQAKELVEAKKAAVKDSLQSIKNQAKEEVKQEVKNQIAKQIFGQKDTTATNDSTQKSSKDKAKDAVKGLKGLFKKN